jgi:hypothetical protein
LGLLAKLDHDDFAVRQQATEDLAKLGRLAETALRRALDNQPSAEAQLRLKQLLAKLDQKQQSGRAPESLLTLRVVEVLEGMGTPEARQFLDTLAKGVPEAELTLEAKAALERLARQPRGTP